MYNCYVPELHRSHTPSNPEILPPHQTMIGLQGRLLLRDQSYLNPEKECTPESATDIITIEERNYTPFDAASHNERKKYWEKHGKDHTRETGFHAKYTAWTESLLQSLNAPENQQHMLKLKGILQQADIADGETFTTQDAEKLYARYFKKPQDPQKTPAGIKAFVADTLNAHVKHTTLDIQTLQNNMTSIRWLSNIFGSTSSELVAQLIEAETRPYTDATLITKLTAQTNNIMRINDLSEREQELLRFLTVPEKYQHTQDERQQETERQPLPIMKFKQEIQDSISNNDFSIIIGGTGCGKTLKVPQFILEIMEPGDKLAVAEPTQINTSELAGRIAQEISGVSQGKQVGFHHGGEKDIGDQNDIVVMTEGILLQKLIHDPLLSEYSHVVADEIHVRNKQGEQALELLIKAQRLRKEKGMKPLKIIGASATADKEELQEYFGGVTPIEVPGKPADIQDHFAERSIPKNQLRHAAAEKIAEILRTTDSGDIECFLKGVPDIEEVEKLLTTMSLDGIKIIRFYRGSTDEEKSEASKDAKDGERRIFLATRFGQTGLTIKGLKHVIISGEDYENNIDPRTGLENVRIVPQSQAEILQCRGRVGRISDGECYYLFTQSEFENRPKYPKPEMKRSDLADVVLALRKSGRHNIFDAQFLSSPLDRDAVERADRTLSLLGAYNPDKTLNAIGRRMAELPVDYHLARIIAEAERRKIGIHEAYIIAVLAENSRAIFSRDKEKAAQAKQTFRIEGSDFLTYLHIWKTYHSNKANKAWAEENGLSYDGLRKIDTAVDKLLNRAKNRNQSRAATQEELEQLIFTGYRDMLMHYDERTKSYRWEREGAPNIRLLTERNSALSGTTPEYIIARNISAIQPGENHAFLSNCQRVQQEWVEDEELPIAA